MLNFGQTCSSVEGISEFLSGRENGPVDFTIIGDSQNPLENNKITDPGNSCNDLIPQLNTSATLNLPAGSTIRAAYLYWSGTGEAIQNVSLNGSNINSNRCWEIQYLQGNIQFTFFSAMSDVTNLVQTQGEGNYNFTGLDNSSWYNQYRCANGGASSLLYGGWAMIVIFENTSFNNNTVFVYDGFRNFVNDQFNVNIQTNVFDNFAGSHVGVMAWEGDDFISDQNNEDRIELNGSVMPSDGYTSVANIFNGTDSFEDPVDNTFFNGDIDDFDASSQVQDLLNTPAANFNFFLRSGQDFILLNALVMRLPNEAPDALIELPDEAFRGCDDDLVFDFNYTYFNSEDASRNLDENTPINFYLNQIGGQIVGNAVTTIELAPGEQDNGTVTINMPADYVGDFEIIGYIDDPASATENYGTVLELFEENNTFTTEGFIDQNYTDYLVELDLCEGDQFVMGDGTVITESGDYPFDEQTQRGRCDSIGVLRVTQRPTYERTNPLEELCEGSSFTRPNGEVITAEPRENPYEFSDLLQSQYGCDSLVHSSFLVKSHSTAEFVPKICLGDGFILPDGTEVFEPGRYETLLPGQSANGCDSIVINTLQVLDVEYPNAFAPNDNGVNEGFRAIIPDICPALIAEYNLKIYNRWGELVFETDDVADPWPGQFNEELGQASLFLWYAEYTTTADRLIKKEGGVTLVR